MRARRAEVRRQTRETRIEVVLDLDGEGQAEVDIPLPFLQHMFELFARHSLFDLRLRARGDLEVDHHHTVEDIGLVLGEALDRALGDRAGIVRYGHSVLPMDESLSLVAVDLGGRPYLVYEIANRRRKILDFDLGLIEEMLRAFSTRARMNLHVVHLYGRDPHHAYESVFKGLARALRMACALDPRERGVPSSKGRI
ncbi:MAG: imidazoleglycerol-phosphate dehydratase HisB [Kiritimatiellae bacterium]|nr:imidazoleglycerol-phosphate dehydratase HisB [Kiritimatiellia bacterium]